MLVMLFTGATFVKKNSCLVAGIDSFDTADLEPYPSKDVELDVIHVIPH